MLLREKDKNTIVDIADSIFKSPLEIWAYGSRVNGDAHDTSDLDMVLVSKDGDKIAIDEFLSFKDRLKKSNIPILTQVLDYSRIPESFHENILLKYEVLFKKDRNINS